MWSLAGRSALVTGAASGGLGEYLALALAAAGADIAILDKPGSVQELHSTSQEVQDLGRSCRVLVADVSDEDQVKAAVGDLLSQWPKIDVLVNAAGLTLRKPTCDTDHSDWQRVIGVNLTGTWLVSREVGRHMVRRSFGAIVNVASQYAALVGPMPQAAYYASKGGVTNLTRALAREWASANIRVNCLAPGIFYPTGMTKNLSKDPERLAWMRSRTLLGRLGDPKTELAGPVVFLASDASTYVTGTVLYVDGGWTAW